MRTQLKTLGLALLVAGVVQAQEVSYETVAFDRTVSPTLTQFIHYTTFDVSIITTQASDEVKNNPFALPYQLKLGTLK